MNDNDLPSESDKLDLPSNLHIGAPQKLRITHTDGSIHERQEDGSLRKVADAPTGKLSWRDRAMRAEPVLIDMVRERQLLQQLLLELCLKLANYGFECEAGPLETCDEFMQIQAFAKGVPHITRPLIDDMALDGTRAVKRTHSGEGSMVVILECGHDVDLSEFELVKLDEKPTVGGTFPCPMCITILQEKGLYEEA